MSSPSPPRPRPAPARRSLRWWGATALAAVAATAATPTAASEVDEPAVPAAVEDTGLMPGLVDLEVHSAAHQGALLRWEATVRGIERARETADAAGAAIAHLEQALPAAEAARLSALHRQATAGTELAALEGGIANLAVRSYMSGGPGALSAQVLVTSDAAGESWRRGLLSGVSARKLERRDEVRIAAAAAAREVSRLERELETMAAAEAAARHTLAQARDQQARLVAALPGAERAVRDTRRTAVVAGTDLPLVALDAYLRAAHVLARERPACGLQWWMLAAIGWMESRHGRIFGTRLLPEGRTATRIIGIPLDGTNGTMLVPDTDGGRLDGDPVFDRAVGPMQFIPQTWRSYARDGTGDGNRDPHNLYDAALSAAHYLCARTPTMRTADGERRAYLAYNRSGEYADRVTARGRVYAQLDLPTG